MSINFKAGNDTIKNVLFANDYFRVPEYQRPYSWTIDEATDFWNDIMNSDDGYFIGSFVLNYEYTKQTNRVDIIDGQQRSLTITIFLSALRDICLEKNSTEFAQQIQNKYIMEKDSIEGTTVNRILPGETTADFFNLYIQSNQFPKVPIKKSSITKEEKKILEVYDFFKLKLDEQIGQHYDNDFKNKLKEILNKVLELNVISIKIESESDAYIIFESVNARGAALTVSDLVKNLIFKHYDQELKKLPEAKELRGEIESNINDSGLDMPKFLRHYRLSKYKYIGEKEVFRAIKEKISNYEEFLNEIYDQSFIYKIILKPFSYSDSDLINQLGINEDDRESIKNIKKIFYSMKMISIFQVKQFSAIFLSILRNYNELPSSPLNLVQTIEKFSYIYFGISSLPARALEKEGSKIAVNIEQIMINSPQISRVQLETLFNNYKTFLKENLPSFEQFIEDFKDLSYKKSGLVKYTLMKISEKIQTQERGEDLFDYSKLNIEHILPQNPSERGLTKKDIKEYVDKIGNLTLLGIKMNSSIQNKALKKKINDDGGLKDSDIQLTKQLVSEIKDKDYERNKEDILSRQKELGEKVFHIQTF